MSAYPTFSELFPTHLRATGVGVCVGFGRIGAIFGVVVLAESASTFGLWTGFLCLAGLWLIGTIASAIWWLRGVEGRGRPLEALARVTIQQVFRPRLSVRRTGHATRESSDGLGNG